MKPLLSVIITAAILICAASPCLTAAAEEDFVAVSDFGAYPDDQTDDSRAIQSAISYAAEKGISTVTFEKGVYDFSENPVEGYGENAYIFINKAKNLKLKGSVDENGNPSTQFVRFNSGENSADLRQLMMIIDCDNIEISNIKISTEPYYYSAGYVHTDGDKISVTVLDGYPCNDNMAIYLPGLYSLKSRRIIEQRLYYNDSDSPSTLYFTKAAENQLFTESKPLAERIAAAQEKYQSEEILLYWFQGNFTPSCQLIKNFDVRGIIYSNIDITSSTGFGLTCDFCRDVTFKNVTMAPDEKGILSAPRDGFHLAECSGTIIMDGILLDGMSDDGQNVHSCFYSVKEKINPYTMVVNNYKFSAKFLEAGSRVTFLTPNSNKEYFSSNIKSVEKANGETVVELCDELPGDIVFQPSDSSDPNNNRAVTLVSFSALCPDKYILKNSTVRNTWRGLKLSCKNAEIFNNLFESNQYNILIGAENDPWFTEGEHPENIKIYGNTFDSPLSGISIDIGFKAFTETEKADVMSKIQIFNNSFSNCSTALSASGCSDTFIYGNTFYNVGEEIKNAGSDIVTTAPADLIITDSGSVSSNIGDGGSTKFYAVIRNTGEYTADKNFEISFYHNGMLAETVLVDKPLSGGGFTVVQTSGEYKIPFGRNTVTAYVNPEQNFFESDYENNIHKSRITAADS